MKRKKGIIIGMAVLLVGGAGAWGLLQMRTPTPTGDVTAVAKYIATDKFAALSSDKQKAYIDELMKNREAMDKMDPEVRRAAWEAARDIREQQELRDYMKASPAERKKQLDERIKVEEERRKEWEKRRAEREATGGENRAGQGRPEGGNRGGPGGRGSPERQKARLENRDPGMRAASAQYRADMAARRAELGLPGGGGGRGPR